MQETALLVAAYPSLLTRCLPALARPPTREAGDVKAQLFAPQQRPRPLQQALLLLSRNALPAGG